VGGLAWRLELAPPLVADASPLATLPLEIAGWRGEEIPLDAAVERELRAEFNLQRAYLHPSGELVWLYVGYYGTTRGGRPEHTPRGCYTGAGWHILETRALAADPRARLRVNEFLVERDGEQQLVHFWYRSHRRTGLLGGLDQNLDRLLGRLLDARADGALVRVSAPVRADDLVGARGRLLAFASALDPLVAERWPTERPARSSPGSPPRAERGGSGTVARSRPYAHR
jgi:EpsI family protein